MNSTTACGMITSLWSGRYASGLSRTSAAEAIAQGLVSLNYSVCLKPDAPVKDGDVLSLRGRGKGCVQDAGGKESRKGRLFVKAEIYQ